MQRGRPESPQPVPEGLLPLLLISTCPTWLEITFQEGHRHVIERPTVKGCSSLGVEERERKTMRFSRLLDLLSSVSRGGETQ